MKLILNHFFNVDFPKAEALGVKPKLFSGICGNYNVAFPKPKADYYGGFPNGGLEFGVPKAGEDDE